MDILLSISDELMLTVLQDWLQLKEIVRLEQAYRPHISHAQFRRILTCGTFSFPNRVVKETTQCMCIAWLHTHDVKVSTLEVPLFLPIHRDVILLYFEKHGLFLKELNIRNCGLSTRDPGNVIDDCLVHCANVVKLVLMVQLEWNEAFLSLLTTCCPRLQTLHITHFDLTGPFNVDNAATTTFGALHSFCVEGGSIETEEMLYLSKLTPNLQTLALSHMGVEAMPADEWRSLRHLELTNSAVVGDWWPHLTQLTSLKLSGSGRFVTPALVREVANHCTSLTKLTLQCLALNSDDLLYILERCHQLTIILLSLPFHMTDATLQCITKYCPQLRELFMPGSYATEKGLMYFAQNCGVALKRVMYSTTEIEWKEESADAVRKVFERKGVEVVIF